MLKKKKKELIMDMAEREMTSFRRIFLYFIQHPCQKKRLFIETDNYKIIMCTSF